MLAKLVKEHQTKQQQNFQQTEQLRKEAIQSVGVVTNQLMDSVNMGVAHVFANQKKLEEETRKLQAQTAKFAKQTAAWLTLIEGFNNSLKELGDIDNWSKVIETDMKQISATLEYVQKN